jgi:hypothetical protein
LLCCVHPRTRAAQEGESGRPQRTTSRLKRSGSKTEVSMIVPDYRNLMAVAANERAAKGDSTLHVGALEGALEDEAALAMGGAVIEPPLVMFRS